MKKTKHKHKIKIENKEVISGKRKLKAFKVSAGHRLVSDEAKFKLHVQAQREKQRPHSLLFGCPPLTRRPQTLYHLPQ